MWWCKTLLAACANTNKFQSNWQDSLVPIQSIDAM